jgi:uncharacterized cupredoxin-like copper-binding protein
MPVPRSSPVVAILVAVVVGCAPETAPPTPPIVPGTSTAPRDVNLIARDFVFNPSVLDLIPGETVNLHVINGGLDVHEAIIGDATVQDAWEAAESAAADPPPGPTPAVSVPPERAGLRIVVESGQRVDVSWTVPLMSEPLIVGCHIPGHWEKGMHIPVRFVGGAPAL